MLSARTSLITSFLSLSSTIKDAINSFWPSKLLAKPGVGEVTIHLPSLSLDITVFESSPTVSTASTTFPLGLNSVTLSPPSLFNLKLVNKPLLVVPAKYTTKYDLEGITISGKTHLTCGPSLKP